MLDPVDHPANHCDIAVELARRVADHGVEFAAGAGVRREVPGDADGGVAVNGPAIRPVIVAYRNGSPVRLEDLGQVIDSVENDKVASWNVLTRAVVLAVQRQPGTNTVEIVDNIRELLRSMEKVLPASVSLHIVFDRSETIRESVADVKFTLLLTIALVVMVIFLFLRKLSATVIPSLALPMSIIGTFAIMYLLDYSVDNLSLMALTLSVGFVVDDAIVRFDLPSRSGHLVEEVSNNGGDDGNVCHCIRVRLVLRPTDQVGRRLVADQVTAIGHGSGCPSAVGR
jgi:HAE1 family hydrophobic/amphiphilic exporter-1